VRLVFSLFLLLAIAALSWYLYQLWGQAGELQKESDLLTKELQPLQKENAELLAEIKRLDDPENLETELRKAGYAAPGEKVIIIIPKKSP